MARLVAVALALALSGSALAGPFPVDRARTPRALILLQTDLFNAGDWRNLWLTFSPKFRARCDFQIWRARLRRDRGSTNPREKVVELTIKRVGTTKALATYVVHRNGRFAYSGKNDVYVKIGKRWYDELDHETEC